jgi:hypothetical protein
VFPGGKLTSFSSRHLKKGRKISRLAFSGLHVYWPVCCSTVVAQGFFIGFIDQLKSHMIKHWGKGER